MGSGSGLCLKASLFLFFCFFSENRKGVSSNFRLDKKSNFLIYRSQTPVAAWVSR